MSLDLTRLENVHEEGRKTIARCPACAERGMDETGEHLIIQPDGRFGCVVHPGAAGKPHRQRIAKLVGHARCAGDQSPGRCCRAHERGSTVADHAEAARALAEAAFRASAFVAQRDSSTATTRTAGLFPRMR